MSRTKEFTYDMAREIGESIGVDFANVDIDEFRKGLVVELEHGKRDQETNVTNDNLEMTGKIAWAHLKEIPDYYTRLLRMEHEAESEQVD